MHCHSAKSNRIINALYKYQAASQRQLAIVAGCYTWTSAVSLSVCMCVYLLVTFVIPAKIAKLIEVPFGGLTQTGPGNHVLDGAPISQGKEAILGEKWQPTVKYWDTVAVKNG